MGVVRIHVLAFPATFGTAFGTGITQTIALLIPSIANEVVSNVTFLFPFIAHAGVAISTSFLLSPALEITDSISINLWARRTSIASASGATSAAGAACSCVPSRSSSTSGTKGRRRIARRVARHALASFTIVLIAVVDLDPQDTVAAARKIRQGVPVDAALADIRSAGLVVARFEVNIGRLHCPAWLFVQVAANALVLIVRYILEVEIVVVHKFSGASKCEGSRRDRIAGIDAAV